MKLVSHLQIAIRRYAWVLLIMSLTLFIVGLSVGSTGLNSFLDAFNNPTSAQIIWEIRLPRTLIAWLTGALLGLAGAIAQGLFRNLLADPYLLGSASGGTLGVALILVIFNANPISASWLMQIGITGAAFMGALLGVAATIVLAKGFQHTFRLLLAGVIVGVILGALSSAIAVLNPEVLQTMQAFMLGTTSFAGWSSCVFMLVILLISSLGSWIFAKTLDGMILGELTAASLGLHIKLARFIFIFILALTTGTAVSQTGLIAFVGLAAPHLVRSMIKANHRVLLIYSAATGGVLLLAADILARSLISPQELPVGVLTAILGGTYLLWLMHHKEDSNGFI